LLCNLINAVFPGTIQEKNIYKRPSVKAQIIENLNLGIKAAEEIGCVVVNVSSQDVEEGRVSTNRFY
jgi:hypothetical protein